MTIAGWIGVLIIAAIVGAGTVVWSALVMVSRLDDEEERQERTQARRRS